MKKTIPRKTLSNFVEAYEAVIEGTGESKTPIFCDKIWEKAYNFALYFQKITDINWLVWMDFIRSCIKLGAGEKEIRETLTAFGYEVEDD